MKKALKIFSIVLVVLLAAMIIIPSFFKDDILEIAKKEANKSLNAKVEFGDVELSMFRDFPSLSVKINNIVVSGIGEFKNDTLANIGSIGASVNLSSIIGGKQIITNEIFLENSYFNAIVNKKGKANWDVAKEDTSAKEVKKEKSTSDIPELVFETIRLNNINVSFTDHKEETYFSSKKIDVTISGNFSAENTNILLAMKTPDTNVEYGGIQYLNKTKISFDANIAANLKEQIFTFKKNIFKLNQLALSFDGSVDLNEDNKIFDLKIKTNNNDFKTLLSMIPGEFKKDIKDLKTSGKVQLSAYAKGKMTDDLYPAFGARLSVEKAQVQYPQLPESINNINILANITNPGGNLDNTVVDVPTFNLEIAKNPFNFNILVKKPISDPELKGNILGKIDFTKLKKAIPLEDAKIEGFVDANITFDGKISHIEKKEYDKFKTKGNLILTNFIYEGKEVPKAIHITKSVLAFSSRQITLKSFNAKIGKSDLSLKGSIKNYIPYAIKDKTLIGNFSMSSSFLDINELMPQTEKKEETTKKEETALSVIEVPNNLDLKLNCNLKKILYDKLIISNTTGLATVKDSKVRLDKMNMNLLKGRINMNGEYNVQNIKTPKINFKFGASDIDLQSTYTSFSIIKEMVPMAMNCSGKVSTSMSIRSILNSKMQIIPKSLNGNGTISSQKILINKNQLLDGLATIAKDNSLRKISIDKIKMSFVIKNGNLTLKPFTTKIAGNPATVYGTQSVEGNMDYTIATSVPKKMLGSDINKTFNNVPGYKSLNKIDIDLKIGGTINKPKVKPDFKRTQKQIAKAAQKELEKKAKKLIDKKTQKKAKDLFKKLFK